MSPAGHACAVQCDRHRRFADRNDDARQHRRRQAGRARTDGALSMVLMIVSTQSDGSFGFGPRWRCAFTAVLPPVGPAATARRRAARVIAGRRRRQAERRIRASASTSRRGRREAGALTCPSAGSEHAFGVELQPAPRAALEAFERPRTGACNPSCRGRRSSNPGTDARVGRAVPIRSACRIASVPSPRADGRGRRRCRRPTAHRRARR